MKRKDFMRSAAGLAGVSLLPNLAFADPVAKKKPLRLAFISDIHLKPGTIPETGMAKALHHVQQLRPSVDFIVNGGDSIMDALNAPAPKVQTQWDLFKKILQQENGLPIYHTIGNHDIWGWFIEKDRPEQDPHYGKQWAMDELQLQKSYYSFQQGNWHFIVLDSTQLNPAGGYIARLDEAQLAWFQQELANIPPSKHICIISHIPVLSICAGLFFNKTEANGDLLLKRNLMHSDFFALKNIFLRYPNIRVCLSGHIHLQDEVEYLGVTYYCNGAVSGNWWNGPYQDFDPAYALIELYDDGTSRRTIMNYQ